MFEQLSSSRAAPFDRLIESWLILSTELFAHVNI